MRTLICLLLIVAAFAAKAESLTFRNNEPYAQVRETLLKHGWRPVHAPDPGFICNNGDNRCEGRPETVACAGTGMAQCVFRWSRQRTILDVNTCFEDYPVVRSFECTSNCVGAVPRVIDAKPNCKALADS